MTNSRSEQIQSVYIRFTFPLFQVSTIDVAQNVVHDSLTVREYIPIFESSNIEPLGQPKEELDW